MNTKQLKEKYGQEKVFIVPIQSIQHIDDKFTFNKHDPKIWSKYDILGKYVYRYEAEGQPVFQQIIPYLIIFNEDQSKMYVSKRIDGDHRLNNMLSLGFGGHINEEDGYKDVVLRALTREMNEELDIDPISKAIYMGTIRDITSKTNDHLGLVFAIKAKEGEVFIKETDKLEGNWMEISKLFDDYHKFENWSKFLIDFLFVNVN